MTDRLSHISQRMATLTLWIIVLMLLLNAACWIFPNLTSIDGGYGLGFALTNALISSSHADLTTLSLWHRAGGIVLSSVPLLALSYGLKHLRVLFQGYAKGDYFSWAAGEHLEKVGRSVTLWVIMGFICEPFLSLWLTMLEPEGHRIITISAQASSIVALFLSACIIVIARILQRASLLNAENQQFV